MSLFSWHDKSWEQSGRYELDCSLNFHPRPDGVLFIIHRAIKDKQENRLIGNNQIAFTADLDQVLQMTNLLLLYLKEITDAKDRREIP